PCPPGRCFAYNNAVYELAREVIEKVAGRPYGEVLKREILVPLKLSRTNTSFDGFGNSGNFIVPHLFRKRTFSATDPSTVYYAYPGAAGLNSNLEDLLKIVAAELGNTPATISLDV